MPEQTKELAAQIVASYLKRNPTAINELPILIASVHQSLSTLGATPAPDPEPLTPAVSIRRSVTPDAVVCLDCGWRGKMLRRHLMSAHDLTPEVYRERWQLKSDHPLTAPGYAARRSALAKQLGLGRPNRR